MARNLLAALCLATIVSPSVGKNCNDGIDGIMPMLQKDIGCVSPHEAEIEYCTSLEVWGGHTICRNGDVDSEKKDGCSHNKVHFCFVEIKFECKVNMVKLKEKIEQMAKDQGGKMGEMAAKGITGGIKTPSMSGRKRRNMFEDSYLDKKANEDNIINGTWKGLCLGGTLKCCADKVEAQGFLMTKIDLLALLLDCRGGIELTQICDKGKAGGPFMDNVKSALMSFMQVEFLRIVTRCITDGPAQIGRKLNCDSPGKAEDCKAYKPTGCKTPRDRK